MTNSIPDIFQTFHENLKKDENKISLLQISGSNEDYLVKEFIYHIYTFSGKTLIPQANFGNTKKEKERQYDIVVFQGGEIVSILEAKYVSSHSRLGVKHKHGSLRKLAEQLKKPDKLKKFGGKSVKENITLFGLVFLSYVREANYPEEREKFKIERIKRARKYGLLNWQVEDSPPEFKMVYENSEVKGTDQFASLYVGLWRLEN